MNPIHDPFSRDAHPDLTAEILKIVNESHSRAELEKLGVARLRELKKKYEARVAKGDKDAARELADIHGLLRAKGGGHALDEDLQTPERAEQQRKRIKRAKLNYSVDRHNPHLRTDSRNRLRQLQKIDKREKEDPKTTWGVSEPHHIRGHDESTPRSKRKRVRTPPVSEAVTPAQKKVFDRERERMHTALNDPNKKLSSIEREAAIARGQRSAAAEVRKGAVSPTGVKGPEHAQAVRYHNYARKESKKLDAILKRKAVKEDLQTPERAAEMAARKKKAAKHSADAMKRNPYGAGTAAIIGSEIGIAMKDKRERESKKTYGKGGKVVREDAQLDERIIDEVDFFQASKNWIKGKGFKTNREVGYDRVKKNYEAMKARQAAEAKGKDKTK